MHIPDGYLGPATGAVMYSVMLPVWALASRNARRDLDARSVPLLGVAAAFSFVIMMFNVPIPGGTTGHAAGAVLAAILLGPWAACIAVTVALAVQALLYGDGGITALGANCFNMAMVMVFAGYYAYVFLGGNSAPVSRRRIWAAGIAGYIGLNLAALSAAVQFGIQPYLHHTADGQALYGPYGLKTALTVMLAEHLLVFGWIEAAVTALVVKYLQKQDPGLLSRAVPGNGAHENHR
jgi:cobalt/nickel transport system permease protein